MKGLATRRPAQDGKQRPLLGFPLKNHEQIMAHSCRFAELCIAISGVCAENLTLSIVVMQSTQDWTCS
jgi:hypothetical protein